MPGQPFRELKPTRNIKGEIDHYDSRHYDSTKLKVYVMTTLYQGVNSVAIPAA